MPFGLQNAVQTFQRFINDVTRGLEDVFTYIDDILVTSASKEDHASSPSSEDYKKRESVPPGLHFISHDRHLLHSDSDNEAVDALSRVTISVATLTDDAVDYHLVSREQRPDTSVTPIIEGQTSLERIKISNSRNDFLCDVSLGYPRPYILPSLRQQFFHACHQHHGIRAPHHLIRSKVVWPAINRDTFPIPDGRFQHIHIDIVGPLPMDDGCSYILTMIDRFTRWPEAMPIHDITAVTVTSSAPGSPTSAPRTPLLPTAAPRSELWCQLMILLGSKRIRTTAYHPCANGMEDLQWTTAEMVYRTMLTLPVYLSVKASNIEPGDLRQATLRTDDSDAQPTDETLSATGHIHTSRTPGLHPRSPLCPPYEGPFPDEDTVIIVRLSLMDLSTSSLNNR
ncbi:uncharacterized protein K02A2.6-like [Penaeus vannamei]|uniref:Uncharacterized protein K02A2.6-like n=1 Tax=Penaeus vannamei TaxID=6689 RepID=A0A423SMX7_PENVA|nr:uncharacterized protein K02A2.6-like [Penaeus vannamei]